MTEQDHVFCPKCLASSTRRCGDATGGQAIGTAARTGVATGVRSNVEVGAQRLALALESSRAVGPDHVAWSSVAALRAMGRARRWHREQRHSRRYAACGRAGGAAILQRRRVDRHLHDDSGG